jgi:glutamate 5-kinase
MIDAHLSSSGQTETLRAARRLVIKVGSALLVDEASGGINQAWLSAFADDVAACRAHGQEVVIVTSGAVATGRRHLGLVGRALKLEEKQAAAATGQIRLAHAWQEALARHALTVAQVLVTPEDTESRQRHLNARATINTLLRLGAIPLINENDTVATDEIRFGDNDRLAARVAQMISADTLVLLSDINGLYTADPKKDPGARLIDRVVDITPEIEAMADKPPPGFSSGGMITKIMAAKIALSAGCRMAIAMGRVLRPLEAMESSPCTWFVPSTNPLSARKKWIAGHVQTYGTFIIDAGALSALQRGKSLLPAGVTAVTGTFERGDIVQVMTADGKEVARGLAAYSSEEASQIKGRQSAEIEQILGELGGRDVLIHRDDLVIIGNA